MYQSFYRLKEKPFQIDTDPRFLWAGEIHKEALSVLKYGVLSRNGILALTGNVGTGKTILINSLLADLDDDVIVANIVNTDVDLIGFINLVGNAFHLSGPFDRVEEFIVEFKVFLQKQYYVNRHVLLIIDEAHKLSLQTLEHARLLTNIEMGGANLFSLFLVGQNELNKKLLARNARALRQRISINYQLKALSLPETRLYCIHRLKVAGGKIEIFNQSAIREIYRSSAGYPRRINVICERALIDGYTKGVHIISADIIKECARELRLPGERKLTLRPHMVSMVSSTRSAVSSHGWPLKARSLYRRFNEQAHQLPAFLRDRIPDRWVDRPAFFNWPRGKQKVIGAFSRWTESGLGNTAISVGVVLLALAFSIWYQGILSFKSSPEPLDTPAQQARVSTTDGFDTRSALLTDLSTPSTSEEKSYFAEPAVKTEPDLAVFFGSKELDRLGTIDWYAPLITPPSNPPIAPPPEVQRTAIEFTASERQGRSKFETMRSFTKRPGPAYSVQVGAFRSEENAVKRKGKLNQKGYAASIAIFNDAKGKYWYTVRIGDYRTLAIAKEKAADFSSKEKMQSIARPADRL